MAPRVLIVGAGVAGFTAALFLHKIGLEVVVYETHPWKEDTVIGAAINLGANGLLTFALYSDDLANEIYKRGHKSSYLEMRDSDGTLLGKFPAGREGRVGKYGTIMVRRWDVQDVLMQEISQRGLKVVYEKKVVEVKETDERVTVLFEDGTSDTGDLVVGADGIRSVVRNHVAPGAKISYEGLVSVGGLLPKAELGDWLETCFPSGSPSDKQKGAIMTRGPLGFFGFAPVDEKTADEGGMAIWWSQFESRERRREEWASFDAMEQLKTRYKDWSWPIPQVLNAVTTRPLVQPIHYLSNVENWHSQRCVLVGDAAHATPPHAGQGVSQAVEDVAELTSVLRSRFSPTMTLDPMALQESFATYERNRRPRVNAILKQAKRNGNNKREKSWLECLVRRWFMILLLAFLPESFTDGTFRCQYDVSIFG